MSAIEDRLRDAYQARAEQLTEARLDALAAHRQTAAADLSAQGYRSSHTDVLPVLPPAARSNRSHRWLAPVLASAAAIALAVGVAAVVTAGHSEHPRPNPPASGVHKPTPTPSKPSSTPSTTGSATGAGPAAAPYLGAGKTGTRAQVPWSQVGPGWRLIQPASNPGGSGAGSSLYLYDPAGGRYLIGQLPATSAVAGWSPDGRRAMLTLGVSSDQVVKFGQLDLSSGVVTPSFTQFEGSFIAYTRPRGLAALAYGQVQGSPRLLRYGTDGTLQLPYPAQLPAVGTLNPATALYTPDGSMLIIGAGNTSVLLSNDGSLIRTFPRPAGTDQTCSPLKLWTADSFLEDCGRLSAQTRPAALYLQPIAGGPPTLLVASDSGAQYWGAYTTAWPLSNGDVLLSVAAECSGVYRILRPDGTTVPLVLPSGVAAGSRIETMQGDRATFLIRQHAPSGCGGDTSSRYSLLDYDMVTGKTRQLLDRDAVTVNFPSTPYRVATG